MNSKAKEVVLNNYDVASSSREEKHTWSIANILRKAFFFFLGVASYFAFLA